MDVKVHTAKCHQSNSYCGTYLYFSHEDVSTLACTWCVLHSVSYISPLTERWCEDSDALYRFVTPISPSNMWKTVFKRKQMKRVLKKKKNCFDWIEDLQKLSRFKSFFKANVCFILALLYCLDTESYHLCELSGPQSEDEERERPISNQQKTHADMQTQPERGQ